MGIFSWVAEFPMLYFPTLSIGLTYHKRIFNLLEINFIHLLGVGVKHFAIFKIKCFRHYQVFIGLPASSLGENLSICSV